MNVGWCTRYETHMPVFDTCKRLEECMQDDSYESIGEQDSVPVLP